MKDSKAQDRLLNLGKSIVNELELDPGVNTLSKWIIHYITEKMELAENLTGNEKDQAEQECFDAILKLWELRWSIPHDKPFLQDFESLFETLDKLNPKRNTPFFIPPLLISEIEAEIQTSKSVHMDVELANKQDEDINPQTYLDSVLSLDKRVRSVISYLFSRAVLGLDLTREREELIRSSIHAIDYPESRIIRITSDYNMYLGSLKGETDETEKLKSDLNSKINDIEELTSILTSIKSRLKIELLELEM